MFACNGFDDAIIEKDEKLKWTFSDLDFSEVHMVNWGYIACRVYMYFCVMKRAEWDYKQKGRRCSGKGDEEIWTKEGEVVAGC